MNTKTLGYGLIGIGLLLLLIKFYSIQVDLTLLFIGGCLLTAYFGNLVGPRRNIGFLIPGSILTALGLWEVIGTALPLSQYEELGFFVAVASAFLAIYLIGSREGEKVFWALIVSVCVYLFSGFLYMVSYNPFFAENQDLLFPAILIAVGLVVIVITTLTRMRKR